MSYSLVAPRMRSLVRSCAALSFAAGLLLCGCTKKQTPESCERSGKELVAFLRQVPANDVSVVLPSGLQAVQMDGEALDAGPVVSLHKGQIAVNGDIKKGATLTEQLTELKGDLGILRGNFRLLHPDPQDFTGSVLILLDQSVPWSSAVALIEACSEAGFDRAQMVTQRKHQVPVARPGPSSADKVLERIRASPDPSVRSMELVNLFAKIISPCEALRSAFADTQSVVPSTRLEYLLTQLPTVLVECKCAVDLPALRAALFALLATGDLENALVQTLVRSTKDAKAPTVSMPGQTLWQTAAPTLLKGARKNQPLRLVAE